jgi:hypothetical protein
LSSRIASGRPVLAEYEEEAAGRGQAPLRVPVEARSNLDGERLVAPDVAALDMRFLLSLVERDAEAAGQDRLAAVECRKRPVHHLERLGGPDERSNLVLEEEGRLGSAHVSADRSRSQTRPHCSGSIASTARTIVSSQR